MSGAKADASRKNRDGPGSATVHGFAQRAAPANDQARTNAVPVPQMAGNLAVQQLFCTGGAQAKFAISHPGDADELEADRVAEQVMHSERTGPVGSSAEVVHRKCAACDAGGTTCPRCADEQNGQQKVQRKALGGGAAGSHARVRALRGGGQPLAAPIRAFFEPHFDRDLGSVRVHTDERASHAAGAIGARAFTLGADIAFGPNQFAPETADGRRLLAHELTHVVQQSNGGAAPRIARDTPAPGTAPARPAAAPTVCYEPKGQTVRFEGVLLAVNSDYLDGELRDYIAKHGEDGALKFVNRFRQHVGAQIKESDDYDVDDAGSLVAIDATMTENVRNESKISVALDKTLYKLIADNKLWLADFQAKADAVVLGMLQESEDRVNQERIRYGISCETVQRTQYRMGRGGMISYKAPATEHSMQDTPASRALAQAATGLLARKRKFDAAERDLKAFSDKTHGMMGALAKERMGAGNDAEMIHLGELHDARNREKRDLDVFRTQKSGEFPILAAYASETEISEENLQQLEKLASGKSAPATNLMGQEIKSRLEHIAEVRTDIEKNHGEETKIWRVPRIIEGTRAITGALPGTMYGRLVDDKVKDEAPGFWTNILIGLLQLALVLLAPVTGGLTLIPAVAISVGQAYVHFKEYERAQMLRGTDFGAMALSSEDPSLFWLAVDIVGAVVDVGAAAGAALRVFRSLAPAARAARAAKTEEAALALERAAGELGGEKLAKAVGRDVRAEVAHVGETAEEAKSLARASEQMAEQELKVGAEVSEAIAGRMVKVSESGMLWSCASPCTLLRERYRALLQRVKAWEDKVKALEGEASKIPKGKGGAAARKDLAERAGALEREMRTKSLPGDWKSPLPDTEVAEMVKRRGSVAAELDHRPPDWHGADEARFRYGKKVEPEPGYRWTLDENGGLRYDRLTETVPPHRYNAATGAFEDAAEAGLITATKGPVEALEFGALPAKQRKAMLAALEERGKQIAKRDTLESAGKLTEKESETLSKTYAKINEQSRQLGENAAEGIMKGKGGKKIYLIGKTHSTSGDFDQVWKVGEEFHIVEAKGGSGALGSRAVGGGMRAEQGTLEYARSIAENMAKSTTPNIRKLGDELLLAINNGKIKYVLVRAEIGGEVGEAAIRVKVSEFVLK